jgi:predicted CXXCH cytochrome family protein
MKMGYERMISTILLLIMLLSTYAYFRVAHCESAMIADPSYLPLQIAFSSTPNSDTSTQINQVEATTPERPNPHWNKTRCSSCHENTGSNGMSKIRKPSNAHLCMDCHEDDIAHVYIHPIGLEISKEREGTIQNKWNGDLRLDKNNKMSCYTCHDLLEQCLPERSHQSKRNYNFLRGGPYPNRYSICYRCHDSTKYERRNPHDQIAKNGYLKLEKCRLCHEIDTEKTIKSGIEKNIEQYPLLNGLNDDRTLLCIRCHRKIDHPSSAFRVKSDKKYRHLVKIGGNEKQTLNKFSSETGVTLPIEPDTGRIYCGTCHQPHQPGVFSGEKISKMSPSIHRLRAKPICKFCHEIYGSIQDMEAR